jgi:surfactin synthase thioesterase subunit
MADRWFSQPPPGPQATVLLFCLPYAGGGSAAYRRWPKVFPPAIGIQPVQLPGREWRLAEPPRVEPGEVADAVLRRADRPFALYGHSMGGLLGYEVTRELRRRGSALPGLLAVGGSRPPHQPESRPGMADLPDDEFAAELVSLGGTPADVLADPDLRELLLPVLRTDLRWLQHYRCPAPDPVPMPLSAFSATEDALVSAADMAGWAPYTSAGFTQHDVPGGHFFVQDPPPKLVSRLTAAVLDPADPG